MLRLHPLPAASPLHSQNADPAALWNAAGTATRLSEKLSDRTRVARVQKPADRLLSTAVRSTPASISTSAKPLASSSVRGCGVFLFLSTRFYAVTVCEDGLPIRRRRRRYARLRVCGGMARAEAKVHAKGVVCHGPEKSGADVGMIALRLRTLDTD